MKETIDNCAIKKKEKANEQEVTTRVWVNSNLRGEIQKKEYLSTTAHKLEPKIILMQMTECKPEWLVDVGTAENTSSIYNNFKKPLIMYTQLQLEVPCIC